MKTPQYKITKYLKAGLAGASLFAPEARLPDGRTVKPDRVFYHDKSAAEKWLTDYHTAYLMARLIEVNTPQTIPA